MRFARSVTRACAKRSAGRPTVRAFACIAAASTVEKDIASQVAECDKKGAAKIVGKVVAERAIAAGIKDVVFDRGGYIYTGRVAELAAGAREGGLNF